MSFHPTIQAAIESLLERFEALSGLRTADPRQRH